MHLKERNMKNREEKKLLDIGAAIDMLTEWAKQSHIKKKALSEECIAYKCSYGGSTVYKMGNSVSIEGEKGNTNVRIMIEVEDD